MRVAAPAAFETPSADNWEMELQRTLTSEQLNQSGERNAIVESLAFISTSEAAERRELYFVDFENRVVRSLKMPEGDSLRDVYRCASPDSTLWSVCYVPEANTLLIGVDSSVLVALQRDANEWHESDRAEMDTTDILCALSDARVLCGEEWSSNMALYRVQTDGRLVLVNSVQVDKEFGSFAATTRDADTLVATCSFYSAAVLLHRLVGSLLVKLSRIQLHSFESLQLLLWVGDTLIATGVKEAGGSHAVEALVVSGTQLTQPRRLLPESERLTVDCWCLMGEQLALFDSASHMLLIYSLPSQVLPHSIGCHN